jgi:hypothetical protein
MRSEHRTIMREKYLELRKMIWIVLYKNVKSRRRPSKIAQLQVDDKRNKKCLENVE